MVLRIEHLMGTVIGVDVRQPARAKVVGHALDAFFETLRDIDARFSPYRADSAIAAEVSPMMIGMIAASPSSGA